MTIRPRRISTVRESETKDREVSPLQQVLIHERHELHKWKETVEIRPPNILAPRQIASHVNAKPLAKLAVSPKCDHVAVMSHRRTFQIFKVDNEELTAESSVQILEDSNAEYCLFEFTASGMLLLSTRSDGSIDVFDRLAEHCYTMIPSQMESSPDLVSAISSLSSYSLTATEERFSDFLTVLHYNCTLSAYKIGRSSYFKLWTVQLDCPLTGVCRILPQRNMLLVSTHYRIGPSATNELPGGLASYRIIKESPHAVPVVAPKQEKDWWGTLSARLPFGTFTYICSLTVDSQETKAVGVTSTGDVFLYALPSLTVLGSFEYKGEPRPRMAEFVHDLEVAILFSNGCLIRVSPEDAGEFLEGIAEADKKADSEMYSARSQMVVPLDRELFILQSQGGPEVAISSQRSSLAARLFLLTIWRSLKQLLGMAVGDAAAPLQQATQLLTLDFTLWHAPIITLEELLERAMRAGDFEKARQLVAVHPEIPSDLVYKRQWLDLCGKGTLKAADVRDVLGRVKDEIWKAERCLQTTTPSLEIQKELVAEGARLSPPLHLHARLLHHGRLLGVVDDVETYLEMRRQTLREVAEGLAERGSLMPLERLLVSNWHQLRPRALSILGSLPTAMEPRRYERLLPTVDGELCTPLTTNKYVAELEKLKKTEEGRREVEKLEGMERKRRKREGEKEEREEGEEEDREPTMEQWAKDRAVRIETETGIVSFAIQLLELCKQRGCEDLDEELVRWRQLESFVRITKSVTASLPFLLSAPSSLLGQHFQVLDDSSLVSSLPDIIKLLEWHSPGEFVPVLGTLLKEKTVRSTKLLLALERTRPELLSEEMLLEALSSLTLTGLSLIESLEGLRVPPKLTRALKALQEKEVYPTFGKLLASQSEAIRAREVLSHIVHAGGGRARSEEEWTRVAADVVRMAKLLYSHLLSEEEAMELVAERFILDEDFCMPTTAPLSTLLQLKPEEGPETNGIRRLAPEPSAKLILRLSESLIASSVTGDDNQLDRARILVEAAKAIAPKECSSLLRSLDVIILASEMGSRRLPIQLRHADAQTLLEEIVGIGENYKKGKRCAKLAQLLRVDTPVATAFAACAMHAVEKGDERTLAMYIEEISSAKNLPVVYTLCVRLLGTPLLPHLREDIEACALANASEEQLEEVLATIARDRVALAEVAAIGEGGEVEENDENLPIPSTARLDPCYTKVEQERPGGSEDCEEDERTRRERHARRLRHARGRNRVATAAREMAAESATAALALGLLCEEGDEEWTGDEKLKRYASALRKLTPQLSGRLVERIPPKVIIDKAMENDEETTALDRLERYDCDRVRFVEDIEYRLDTIDGLAMNLDAASWRDALELARLFSVDEERVHIASLENILTSLPPAEARSLISARGHADTLRPHATRLAAQLRRSVLPLIETDEAYLLYLEQFIEGTLECALRRVLSYLHSERGEKRLKGLLGDEGRLARIVEGIPSEQAEEVARWLDEVPGTTPACEAAVRSMLANRADPKRIVAFSRSPSTLIELLMDVSLDMESDLEWILSYSGLPRDYRTEVERYLAEKRDSRVQEQSSLPISPPRPSMNLTQRRRGGN